MPATIAASGAAEAHPAEFGLRRGKIHLGT